MELKGVIFDLDGTLSDTIPLCITVFRHACETVADKSFTDKEIVAMFGPTEERMCKHAVPENWQTTLEREQKIPGAIGA